MKQLWAPWRMEFIKDKGPKGCVFCELPAENRDRENLILHRAQHSFVILNKFPYNNGHLLIVPNAHIAAYPEVPDHVLAEMDRLTKISIQVLETRYTPQGFNLGMNLGQAAGAGVKDHLHLHIVPRWSGDTNFLPVLAETKCMPQHLETCFQDLKETFDRKAAR